MGSRSLRLSCVLGLLGLACGPAGELDGAPDSGLVSPPGERPRPRPLAPGLRPAIREIGQGEFARARELALAFGELHPQEAQAEFVVGLSYEKAGNHASAAAWFERSLAKAPDDFVLHDYLGRALFLLGRPAEARAHFETHARLDPLEPKAAYGLGTIELEESRLERAEASFRHALELFAALEAEDPSMFRARAAERAECHARLGEVYFSLDRYERARDELETATRLAPEHISAFHSSTSTFQIPGSSPARMHHADGCIMMMDASW